MRHKRRPGGQPGNQNARKHGFYSGRLSPEEICRFWNIVNLEGVDPDIAALRIKLHSVIQSNPGNRRVLLEGVKLLAKWTAAKNHLDPKDAGFVKKAIRQHLQGSPPPTPARSGIDNHMDIENLGGHEAPTPILESAPLSASGEG